MPCLTLVRLSLEYEVHCLGFAAGNSYFLRLLAIGLVPGAHGVLACREIWQAEAATLTRNGIVRILQDREGAVHPGMHVALHGNKFWLVVLVDDGRRPRRLRFGPFAIDLCERMDVFRPLVIIAHS